ncbi:MAG: Gfo/Idh/MocA family oxidoreductase [Ilumatobacteraceae bacterium]|nr:Gfo/Idh/MocA family oxidoreductase [Ilumatobacteraceae bacterium]
MRELRLGLVGCGAIAQWHARALKNLSRTRVTACIDVSPERAAHLASLTEGTVCSTIDEALKIGVDALAILVPHHLHEEVVSKALSAGVHVALEKPMAPSVEACEKILAVAAQYADRVFMLTENAQYWPEVLIAQELIRNGAIGNIITARSWHNFGITPEFYPSADSWRFQAAQAGGGVAIDTGSHWMRPLRMILGEIDEVVAVTARIQEKMQGESLVRALCKFQSGVVASFDVMLATGAVALQPHFQFTGTDGEIVISALGEVRLFDGTDWQGTIVGNGNYMDSYIGVWKDFEAAVLDGTPLAADARYSLGEVRAALAITRSSESQRWEKVW